MKQILLFILFSALLCWFMFAPVYKHVIIMRQAVLQKEADYLLEIGASGVHGYINSVMITESRARLARRGFNAADLDYVVTVSDGSNGMNASLPVLRGAGIAIKITYPYENLFEIDRLVAITPPASGSRMAAEGMKMSEYVP
jgi:hypothetical protein